MTSPQNTASVDVGGVVVGRSPANGAVPVVGVTKPLAPVSVLVGLAEVDDLVDTFEVVSLSFVIKLEVVVLAFDDDLEIIKPEVVTLAFDVKVEVVTLTFDVRLAVVILVFGVELDDPDAVCEFVEVIVAVTSNFELVGLDEVCC